MAARKCLRCARGEAHQFRHGTFHSFYYHDCRCTECRRGTRTLGQKWRDANPDKCRGTHGSPAARRDYYEWNKPQYAQHHGKHLQKFTRAVGAPARRIWSPEEDAIALRDDLTILEIAYLLGRNRGSIMYRRGRLRKEQAA